MVETLSDPDEQILETIHPCPEFAEFDASRFGTMQPVVLRPGQVQPSCEHRPMFRPGFRYIVTPPAERLL
jgi:hypothetical protein